MVGSPPLRASHVAPALLSGLSRGPERRGDGSRRPPPGQPPDAGAAGLLECLRAGSRTIFRVGPPGGSSMSKAITFFRNRQQETGQTYEFEIEDSARRYQIFVYSRNALEETLVRSRQLRGGSSKAEVDKIKQALLQSGGGVIASTYEENRERVLVIFPVASGGKATCGAFGLLLPGHPSLSLETLSENGIYFPQGSQALVPVDKEAEDSLRGLQKYVGFLPPDLESLVFHAI